MTGSFKDPVFLCLKFNTLTNTIRYQLEVNLLRNVAVSTDLCKAEKKIKH